MANDHKTDIPDGSCDSVDGLRENTIILKPVSDNASGEGLPYAPVDWPNPGDVWKWRVGKRKDHSGFIKDRFLYPPNRFRKSTGRKAYFASMHAVKEFVRREFPKADVDAFFASFSWKVPGKDHDGKKDLHSKEVIAEHPGSQLLGGLKCKARNKICGLQPEARNNCLPVMNCDICCNESGFCRDCCCILCSRSIDWAHGGYSFIRCEANVNGNSICGHASHIDCALRSYMAGTVGGSIGLDVEFYCRRCDKRTDLISHVMKLLETCESLDSRDEIEKILKTGLCILRGTHRESAKVLLNRIELVLSKHKSGIDLKDIWNVEEISSTVSLGAMSHPGNTTTLSDLNDANGQYPLESNDSKRRCHQPLYITSDHHIESLKLEEEIEQVLQDLKSSQELEYRMAEQKLNAQKHLLITLSQQLEADRSELAKCSATISSSDVDALLASIFSKINQIKREVEKFKGMEEVAKGFGFTPRSVLKEHFGFQFDD